MSRAFSCLFHQLLLAVLDVEAFGGNVCEATALAYHWPADMPNTWAAN